MSASKLDDLVFILEPHSVIAECIRGRGHHTPDIARTLPRGLARVRRWHLASQLPFQGIWFRFSQVPASATAIVIFDQAEMFAIARGARRRFPNARILLWFWNPIPKSWRMPDDLRQVEAATFDPDDAAKHDLTHHSTFYFHELRDYFSTVKDHDIVFIGRDKGRHKILDDIEQAVQSAGGRTHVRIVEAEDPYIPYRTVLALSGRSNATLDIVQPGQHGLTLRAMEALFLGTKLVTNNAAILTETRYPKSNVWVLDANRKQDLNEMATFILSSTQSPPPPDSAQEKSAREYYDFNSWLQRLLG